MNETLRTSGQSGSLGQVTLEAMKESAALRADWQGAHVKIWSGEWRAWWRDNASGYTIFWADAGVYPFSLAWLHIGHAGPEKQIEFAHVELPNSSAGLPTASGVSSEKEVPSSSSETKEEETKDLKTMSMNCINCAVNKRTGPDLLCDSCRHDKEHSVPDASGEWHTKPRGIGSNVDIYTTGGARVLHDIAPDDARILVDAHNVGAALISTLSNPNVGRASSENPVALPEQQGQADTERLNWLEADTEKVYAQQGAPDTMRLRFGLYDPRYSLREAIDAARGLYPAADNSSVSGVEAEGQSKCVGVKGEVEEEAVTVSADATTPMPMGAVHTRGTDDPKIN